MQTNERGRFRSGKMITSYVDSEQNLFGERQRNSFPEAFACQRFKGSARYDIIQATATYQVPLMFLRLLTLSRGVASLGINSEAQWSWLLGNK